MVHVLSSTAATWLSNNRISIDDWVAFDRPTSTEDLLLMKEAIEEANDLFYQSGGCYNE